MIIESGLNKIDTDKEVFIFPTDQLALEKGCYFDEQIADRVIAFIEKYIKPQMVSGTFKSMLWQRAFWRTMYGHRDKKGNKRFQTINLHCSKKQGKLTITGAIILLEMLLEDVEDSQGISVSTSAQNACQCYREVMHSIKHCIKQKYFKPSAVKERESYRRIEFPSRNARFWSAATCSDSIQGENLSYVAVDEGHSIHDSGRLYNALKYAGDSRQGKFFMLFTSTAGDDTSQWYYQIYLKSCQVLKGESNDYRHMGCVYECPENLVDTEEGWRLASPSYGVVTDPEKFKEQYDQAKLSAPEWLNFQRYKLNRWISANESALIPDLTSWEKYTRIIPDEELQSFASVLSCDCSERIDPTSLTVCFSLPDNRFHFKTIAYVCRDGYMRREKSLLTKYNNFVAEGSMIVSEGNMIDRPQVLAKAKEWGQKYKVQQIIFDPHVATVMGHDLAQMGFQVNTFSQSHRMFNTPIKEFSRAYQEGRLSFDCGQWGKWNLGNALLDLNTQGEARLMKRTPTDKIDFSITAVMSFSGLLTKMQQPTRLLNTDEILWFA